MSKVDRILGVTAALTPSPLIRIGELSRRVGVSEHTLRAWESRYGLLRPTRSAGGYRLYSPRDEAVVRRMTMLMTAGLSAAEAAETALADRQEFALPTEMPFAYGGGGITFRFQQLSYCDFARRQSIR